MKNTFLFVLFFSISVLGISQSTEPLVKPKFTPLIKPNTIAFTGTFEEELIVSYERLIGRSQAIEIGFGKKWGQRPDQLLYTEPLDHENINTSNYVNMYSGYLGSLTLKRYLAVPKHPIYLSFGLTYKNYFFDPMEVKYDDGEFGWSGGTIYNCEIISSKKQVLVAKLLFGEKFNFRINPKVNFVLDVYTGVGFRGKFYNDEILAKGSTGGSPDNCNCIPLADPIHKNSTVYMPSFQLGFKAGIGF